jgi:hypothetical protein
MTSLYDTPRSTSVVAHVSRERPTSQRIQRADAAGFVAWIRLRAADPALLAKITRDRIGDISGRRRAIGKVARASRAYGRGTHQTASTSVEELIAQIFDLAEHLRAVAKRKRRTASRLLVATSLPV